MGKAMPLEPRLLSVEHAARYCGVSRNQFLAHVAPHVGCREIGQRRLYDRFAIDRWLDGAPVQEHGSTPAEEWPELV